MKALSLFLFGLIVFAQPLPALFDDPGITLEGSGYKVKVPSNWTRMHPPEGTDMLAMSPFEGLSDRFRENLNVSVIEMTRDWRLDDFFERSVVTLKETLYDFREEERGSVKLGDVEARYVVFYHRKGRIQARMVTYIAIANDSIYLLSMGSSPEDFERFRKTFETIASTLEVGDG